MPVVSSQDVLLSRIIASGARSVALIGMVKNAGKTVVFNHLLKQAADCGLQLGLTSVGRDGEQRDAVFNHPKPRIFAPAGSLVATARETLKRCQTEIEILQGTGFLTAMGEVLLGRASQPGFVELAGPTRISQHQALLALFKSYGVDLAIVDGALDRISPASPRLADGIILATGAALSPSMEAVLTKTQDRIARLCIPEADAAVLALCRQVIAKHKAALIDGSNNVTALAVPYALNAGELLRQRIKANTELVVLSGAIGDSVLEGILASARKGNVQLIINNGAALFCSKAIWHRFSAAGGSIRVVEPIRLLAITLNPVSPTGPSFEPQLFLTESSRAFAPYLVADVVLGHSAGG